MYVCWKLQRSMSRKIGKFSADAYINKLSNKELCLQRAIFTQQHSAFLLL
jgi:hypothetical protein